MGSILNRKPTSKGSLQPKQKEKKKYVLFGHSHLQQKFFKEVLPFLSAEAQYKIKGYQWQWSWLKKKISSQQIKMLGLLEKTQCKSFRPRSIHEPPHISQIKFLPLIQNISFNSLIKLNLQWNSISNIEALAHLDMEKLRSINLNSNHISNIKPIHKTKWIQLQEFIIYWNNLPTIQLSRSFIKQLSSLQCGRDSKQQIQLQDSRILVKVKFVTPSFIFQRKRAAKNFIFNQKAYLVFYQKHQISYITTQKKGRCPVFFDI